MSMNQFSSMTSNLSSKMRLSSPIVVVDDECRATELADEGMVREYFSCSQLVLPVSLGVKPREMLISSGAGSCVKRIVS